MADNAAPKYAAFISYAREDDLFAHQLETAIEAFVPPTGGAAAVFRDRSDFTGNEYRSALDGHLRESASLLVVCSPDARKSQYVNDEIRNFARLHGADRIFSVLLSGLPNNEADDLKAFPPALAEAMPGMPLGAEYRGFDARRDHVGSGRFENEWFKLLANIHQVGTDVIREHDKQRQVRQLRWRLATSVAGGVVLLAVVALIGFFWMRARSAEHDAEEQRKIAKNALAQLIRATEAGGANADLSAATERAQTALAAADRPIDPAPEAGPALAPRVYLHIRTPAQRAALHEIGRRLQGASASDGQSFVVPGIQQLTVGPRTTELRYFRDSEQNEAQRIVQLLQSAGLNPVVARKVPGYETSSNIRQRHYELWLSPDALLSEP